METSKFATMIAESTGVQYEHVIGAFLEQTHKAVMASRQKYLATLPIGAMISIRSVELGKKDPTPSQLQELAAMSPVELGQFYNLLTISRFRQSTAWTCGNDEAKLKAVVAALAKHGATGLTDLLRGVSVTFKNEVVLEIFVPILWARVPSR